MLTRHPMNDRARDMIARYRAGEVMRTIAVRYGVSIARVHQILAHWGITGVDGGRLGPIARAASRAKRPQRKSHRLHPLDNVDTMDPSTQRTKSK